MTHAPAAHPFRILIDGQCVLCRTEGRMLERLDAGRGRLEIVDITAPEFDPAAIGATHDQVMGKIHGITADGRVITGMEVFRWAYRAVGWGWLWAPTGWPLLRPIFDAFYRWFARNRYWLTGRRNPCTDGACKV